MNREQLLEDVAALSDAELQAVCGRLGVSFTRLGPGSMRQKGERLLAQFTTGNRLPELLAELVHIRPYLAARYDQADPLGWLEQLDQPPGMANPPQITSNIEKLNDFAPAPGAAERRRSARRPAKPMQEAPTARWDSERQPRPPAAADESFHMPYQPGDLLHTQALFFGRRAERQLLSARLREMASCAIVGLPYSGKSSLAYQVLEFEMLEPAWNSVSAFLELSQLRYAAAADLLNHILEVWYRQMRQETAPRVNNAAEFVLQVGYLAQGGYRPVLCLDGLEFLFAQPFEPDEPTLRAWHALYTTKQLALLVTSQAPPADLLRQRHLDPALLADLIQVDLGLLDEADARELVRQPAARQQIYLPPAIVETLLTLCGLQPFFLQLGAALYVSRPEEAWSPAALQEAYARAAEPYFAALWQALLPLQRSLLAAPLRPDPPIVVARQYRALARYGLLAHDAAGYRPFGAAFARWLETRAA